MPIYEYQCGQCEHTFEEWQKDFSERDVPCPECGGASQRLISNTAFILKGSGWYVTDYARNGKNGSNGTNGNGKPEKAASGEAKDSSAKSETTTTSETAAKTDSASKSSDSGATSKTAAASSSDS